MSRPATASTGERKSNRNELDTILNDMTHQVEFHGFLSRFGYVIYYL